MDIDVLGPDDWELLREVRLKSLVDTPGAFVSSHAAENTFAETHWRRSLRTSVWVVARYAGSVIGIARSRRVAGRPERERHIEAVWIEPEWRRNGVTRALFEALTRVERENGVTDFCVWVIRENWPAPVVYKRLGFTSTGEVADLDDGTGRTEERFRLSIG